jgi:hypothetical protein
MATVMVMVAGIVTVMVRAKSETKGYRRFNHDSWR